MTSYAILKSISMTLISFFIFRRVSYDYIESDEDMQARAVGIERRTCIICIQNCPTRANAEQSNERSVVAVMSRLEGRQPSSIELS